MDTIQHIAAARTRIRTMTSHLDRMSALAGARNPEAMATEIRDLLCDVYTLQQEMRPLELRTRAQVQKKAERMQPGKAVA